MEKPSKFDKEQKKHLNQNPYINMRDLLYLFREKINKIAALKTS